MALGGAVGLAVGLVVLVLLVRDVAPAKAFAGRDVYGLTVATRSSDARASVLADSVAALKWPSPLPLDLRDDRAPEWLKSGCLANDVEALQDPVKNAERCVFGDERAQNTIVVIGDSTAISYMPAILAAFSRGWRIEVWTMGECSPARAASLDHTGAPYPKCDAFRSATETHLAQTHPQVVIASNSEYTSSQMASGNGGVAIVPRWKTAWLRTLRTIAPEVGRFVLLDAPPVVKDVSECRTPMSAPADCNSGVDAHYVWAVRGQEAAVQEAEFDNVTYVHTLSWFCTSEAICPAYSAGTLIRADSIHLRPAASRELAGLLKEALEPSS